MDCSYLGGQMILDKLEAEDLLNGKISIETTKCFEKICVDGENSPIVEIDGKIYKKMSIEKVSEIIFMKLKGKR